jgi:hypothetical protein
MIEQAGMTPAKRGNSKGNDKDFPTSRQLKESIMRESAGDSWRDETIRKVAHFLADARGFPSDHELEDGFEA